MSVGYPLYFFLPTVMVIAFCVGAIIFVASRPSEFGRPKRYAVTALSLILIGQFVFPLFFSGFIFRFVDSGSAGAITGLAGIFSTLAMVIALTLLIVAVFIDRTPAWQPPDGGGTPLADRPSSNPYAAPRR